MNPFDIASPEYASVRPAYPASVVDQLVEVTRRGLADHSASKSDPAGEQGPRIADIGAGTGKMSALIAERGICVEAVEPSEAMRQQMSEALEDRSPLWRHLIAIHNGTAEDTGLPTGSVDLVVYAQSWHWVDEELASYEASRILKDRGGIGVVWNQMDVSIPWVHRLTRIMRSGDVHRPDKPPSFSSQFTEPVLGLVNFEERITPEDILRLGTTRSSYLRQNEGGRARMQDNLRWYLYEHLAYEPEKPVIIPYTTLVWTAHKR